MDTQTGPVIAIRTPWVLAAAVLALVPACQRTPPEPEAVPTPQVTSASPTPTSASPSARPTVRPPSPVAPTTRRAPGPLRWRKPLTTPGAGLRYGRQALIPYRHGSTDAILGLTVHRPLRGIYKDVAGLNLSAEDRRELRDKVIYFVRATVVNLSGNDITSGNLPSLDADIGGFGFPGSLFSTGGEMRLPKCHQTYLIPDWFDRRGERFTYCESVVFSTRSFPVTEIQYELAPYNKRPITWS